MKILFTGGGTGGSVVPLIAIYQKIKKPEIWRQNSAVPPEFFWIGSYDGLEKKMVEQYGIKYFGISSGKLRRYFSWQNFIDPFRVIKGFFQSLKILRQVRPQIIITAGSYISVPVVWAGALLKIPILVHQQDLQRGLANKIMSKWAKKITVSWEDSLKDFYRNKTIYTGNPVREEVFMGELPNPPYQGGYDASLSTVLILGGGTGAEAINQAVEKHLAKLVRVANIIHITGKGKKIETPHDIANISRYHQFEFVDKEFISMMKLADLIITRAGMSTLSELAVLGKPTVIVPMPNTHQERNAHIFYKNNAAIVYEQKYLEDENFIKLIIDLLSNQAKLENLSLNISKMMPTDAAEKVAKMVFDIIAR
jgi:UDP-N-acetylglucosamine--N-acetylmuramyl-(pentapeptide) pyrophosphoryl-undecaprenol N-acetylglucosamine transferase